MRNGASLEVIAAFKDPIMANAMPTFPASSAHHGYSEVSIAQSKTVGSIPAISSSVGTDMHSKDRNCFCLSILGSRIIDFYVNMTEQQLQISNDNPILVHVFRRAKTILLRTSEQNMAIYIHKGHKETSSGNFTSLHFTSLSSAISLFAPPCTQRDRQ